jgi:hypothetical protein
MAVDPALVVFQSDALYRTTEMLLRLSPEEVCPEHILDGWKNLAINALSGLQEYGEGISGKEQRKIKSVGNKIITTLLDIEFPHKDVDNTRKEVLHHLFAPREKNGKFSRDPRR